MKRSFILLFLVLALAACHSTKNATSSVKSTQSYKANSADRDGTSFEKAIVIQEKSEMTGVSAEYAWLAKHYPGYQSNGQSLVTHNKTPFDIIKIKTSDGKEMQVYFDISNYFGKF